MIKPTVERLKTKEGRVKQGRKDTNHNSNDRPTIGGGRTSAYNSLTKGAFIANVTSAPMVIAGTMVRAYNPIGYAAVERAHRLTITCYIYQCVDNLFEQIRRSARYCHAIPSITVHIGMFKKRTHISHDDAISV